MTNDLPLQMLDTNVIRAYKNGYQIPGQTDSSPDLLTQKGTKSKQLPSISFYPVMPFSALRDAALGSILGSLRWLPDTLCWARTLVVTYILNIRKRFSLNTGVHWMYSTACSFVYCLLT